MILKRNERHFLPENFDLNNWDDLKPFYQDLDQRIIKSSNDFSKWLQDKSELDAYISENLAWRYIKMTIDTSNQKYLDSYQYFVTKIQPEIMPFDNLLNIKLSNSPYIADLGLSKEYEIYFRSIQTQLQLYKEENIPIQTELSEMSQKYGAISGAQSIEYDGNEITIQKANLYLKEPDESIRIDVYNKIVYRKKKDFKKLDDLFSDLIKKRHQLALNAGFENFRDYKFKSMGRFDYSMQDCFDFHDSVEKNIVPLVKKIQLEKLNKLDKTKFKPWDTSVDPDGRQALKPFKDVKELLKGTILMLDNIDPYFADCIASMDEMGHLDLDSKKGKSPGGYNYPLYEIGVPFIFMNAVGSHRDLITMIHEGGHAIHSFLTRDLNLTSFKDVPSEVAELASMSMELLTIKNWDVFYSNKNDLSRAIKEHLEDILKVLPWIAQIDAFQHWIYENPNHTSDDRSQYWVQLCNRFGTGLTDWDGYEDVLSNSWQGQLHLFEVPFYYIEYGIAQLGAIGIWKNSKLHYDKAINDYKSALSLGYTKTIPEIYKMGGVRFDFSNQYIKELSDFVWNEIQKLK